MNSDRWWKDVDMIDLAVRLGLEKPRQKGKWACPACGSRDNLHIYSQRGRGAHCFGCGPMDAPAMVMAVRGGTFPEALKFIDVNHKPDPHRYSEPRPKRRMPEINRDEVTALAWIYEHCDELSSDHTAWLNGRGIKNDFGLKTATPEFWREVSSFEGSPTLNSKGNPHPWWRHPFIVLPYYDEDGTIVDLRFRRTHDEDGPKMLSFLGTRAVPLPYLGWAPAHFGRQLSADEIEKTSPLWIVEGEWDAMLLQYQHSLTVVATPGASIWHDEWTDWLKTWCLSKNKFGITQKRQIIVCGDGDEAGQKMSRMVHRKLHAAGLKAESRTWSSGDAGDLHAAGLLRKELGRTTEYTREF